MDNIVPKYNRDAQTGLLYSNFLKPPGFCSSINIEETANLALANVIVNLFILLEARACTSRDVWI